jgi:hypothetical protein
MRFLVSYDWIGRVRDIFISTVRDQYHESLALYQGNSAKALWYVRDGYSQLGWVMRGLRVIKGVQSPRIVMGMKYCNIRCNPSVRNTGHLGSCEKKRCN